MKQAEHLKSREITWKMKPLYCEWRRMITTKKTVHKILYLIVCFQAQDQTQAEKGF